MKRSLPLLLGVSAACVALDQWTKHWATERLAFSDPVRVLGDLVSLTYTRNSGIAFGLFAGRPFPFYIFSMVAAVAVFVLFFRHARLSLARQLSLALILGGAIGNLIDRLATGEVVDFILLSYARHSFPVFNVADICVTTGVALFALVWTREPEADAASPEHSTRTAEHTAHDTNAGTDRDTAGSGTAGGSLAREGADRPQP